MLIRSTVLIIVVLLHLGAKKGYTQPTHLEPEHEDDYYGDFCKIREPFLSPYVRAFYDAPHEGTGGGCTRQVDEEDDGDDIGINSSTSSTAQEIHVIRIVSSHDDGGDGDDYSDYDDDDGGGGGGGDDDGPVGSTKGSRNHRRRDGSGVVRVNLRIKSLQDSPTGLLEKKLTFVLVSEVMLRWKIHLERINHSSEFHIWVTNGSSVVQDRSLNMKVRQVLYQSSNDPLLDWISQKLGPVTTVVEVKSTRTIVHVVGIADVAKMCDETALSGGREQGTGGCLATSNKNQRNKNVHIIELRGGFSSGANHRNADDNEHPPTTTTTVTVAVHPKSNSKPLLRKHLLLVLKSRDPTRWKVQTSGLRGTLNIVTDRTVDTSGVTMQAVGVVSERLSSLSGIELVVWTSEKYGEPVSYTYSRLANRFDLTVDGQDEAGDLLPQVTCNPDSMVIGLSRRSLANKFSSARLSLGDQSCRMQKNRTHYFWTASLTSCGTIQTLQNNQITYKNAIVVRPQRPSYGQLPDELGSGVEPRMEEDSLDSESSGDIRLDFECTYPSVNAEEINFSMKLYKDPNFQLEVLNFPAIFGDKETLFMEASISQDPRMILAIHNCSVLSPSLNQPGYQLVRNGCPLEERIRWLVAGSSDYRQRYQLAFEKSWSGSVVQCLLSACAKTFLERSPKIDPCPSPKCLEPLAKGGSDPIVAGIRSVSMGPWILQEKHISDKKSDLELQATATEVRLEQDDLRDGCGQEGVVHTEGLDPTAVVGIAFAAFVIGVLLTGALWFIHSQTGPIKKHAKGLRLAEASGESTPISTAPAAVRPSHQLV